MKYKVFSISIVVFVYSLILYLYLNKIPICKHSILPGFEDLRYVSRFMYYNQIGDDIYSTNQFHTPYVYPRFSLTLFQIFTFKSVSINTFSIFLILFFLAIVYLQFDFKNKVKSIFYTLFLISPAILLLLERMNIDLIIFLLLITAIYFRKHNSKLFPIYLFYLFVCILSLVKIYPIILLTLLPFENLLTKKSKIILLVLIGLIFTTVNLFFYKDYLIMLKNIPQPSELAFGRFVLFNEYFSGINLKIISLLPFIFFLILFFFKKNTAFFIFRNEEEMTNNYLMFLVGGGIYSFSFIMSNNYDYRLVFLILTIPYFLEIYQNKMQYNFFLFLILILIYTSAVHLYIIPFQNYTQWFIGRNFCMIVKYLFSTYLASFFVYFFIIHYFKKINLKSKFSINKYLKFK